MGGIERGVKHFRVRQVRRHVDAGQRDHAYARVAQLALHQIRQLALDQVAQLLRASLALPHNVRATSCTSNTSNWSFSWRSEKFLSDMPHSKPALTSRTSSLKRFSESMSPLVLPPLPRSPP